MRIDNAARTDMTGLDAGLLSAITVHYRVREKLDRATRIWGVKIFSDLNTFPLVKCNVIGTAKEGTCWLYCSWVILNESGRKRNCEGVDSR